MRIIILGAGAGGGLPQWNCGCPNCNAARRGVLRPMSQSSIAVSADGTGPWAIINASPDLRAQMAAAVELHPTGLRDSPLAAVLLTNGDLDHVAGLLSLREGQRFRLVATPAIHAILRANPILEALDPALVLRESIELEDEFALVPGVSARMIAVPGKVPLYLEGADVKTDEVGEQTVAVELRSGESRVLYVPGCAALPAALAARIAGADALLFDGTLWSDDEMIRAGLGHKTGRRMGHMPVGGPGGSIAALAEVPVARRIFVHLNNSNPLVDPRSPEGAEARASGWEVAHDGQRLTC